MEVSHLKKYFHISSKKVLKAVDDVSFTIYEGETLGIVGESGVEKQHVEERVLVYMIKQMDRFFTKEKTFIN